MTDAPARIALAVPLFLAATWAASCVGGLPEVRTPDSDGDGFPDDIDPTPHGFDGAQGREQPLSTQLHLHGSLSEYDGTMACHTQQAESVGVDVLWWSDHDNMIQMMLRPDGLDFDDGGLNGQFTAAGITVTHGMFPEGVDLAETPSEVVQGGPSGDGHFWRIGGRDETADGQWHAVQYAYGADITSTTHLPLLAGVDVSWAVRVHEDLGIDRQLLFTVTLSSTCEGVSNFVTYFLGGDDLTALTTDTHLYVPLGGIEATVWGEALLPLSQDADHFAELDDQSTVHFAVTARARNGETVNVDLDDLALSWQLAGQALRDRQAEVLAERYSDGPVTQLVGQEITLVADLRHVNPIGAQNVPLIQYETELSAAQAVQHVHDHGAAALCNHPFGTYLGVVWSGEDADVLTSALVEEWLAAGVYGCDLVEVGYPAREVDLEHHLQFWDALSAAGHHLVGVGTSDHHWTDDWLTIPNPFVTWVFLDVPDRAGVAAQLTSGRAFFGDPAAFLGGEPLLDLWSEHGAVMGQVLASDLDQAIHVQTGTIEPGWSLELVVDGEVTRSVTLAGDETDTVFELPRGTITTIRAQLRDDEGTLVLLSNPLWLERPDSAS